MNQFISRRLLAYSYLDKADLFSWREKFGEEFLFKYDYYCGILTYCQTTKCKDDLELRFYPVNNEQSYPAIWKPLFDLFLGRYIYFKCTGLPILTCLSYLKAAKLNSIVISNDDFEAYCLYCKDALQIVSTSRISMTFAPDYKLNDVLSKNLWKDA